MNVTSATSSLRTNRAPVLHDAASTTSTSTSSSGSTSNARVDNFVGAPISEGERNRKVVDDFYKAFARKDGAAMTAAYASNAKFSDPVFPKLENGKGAAMWRMLCRSDELKVRHEILKVDGDTVTARWVANYKFLGNDIENTVTSTIKLKDGKIVDHKDSFDMSRWLGQAYGMAAKLPFAEHVLGGITRHVAGNRLDNFIANER